MLFFDAQISVSNFYNHNKHQMACLRVHQYMHVCGQILNKITFDLESWQAIKLRSSFKVKAIGRRSEFTVTGCSFSAKDA